MSADPRLWWLEQKVLRLTEALDAVKAQLGAALQNVRQGEIQSVWDDSGGSGTPIRIKVTGDVTAATWASGGPTAWGAGRCRRVLGLNGLGDEEPLYSHGPDDLTAPAAAWATIINGELWLLTDFCSTVPV